MNALSQSCSIKLRTCLLLELSNLFFLCYVNKPLQDRAPPICLSWAQRAGPGPWGRQRRSERIEIFLRFTFCTGLELNCLLLLTADKVTNLGNWCIVWGMLICFITDWRHLCPVNIMTSETIMIMISWVEDIFHCICVVAYLGDNCNPTAWP